MPERIGRRKFLGAAAAAGWVLGAGGFAAAQERDAAEKLVVGVMGTNGRGSALARGFARLPGAEVGYVCDVDERAVANAKAAVVEAGGREPQGAKDFRRVLDDPAVDALVIAAPNHWHGPATILACAAGKHVYVEKPCSHTPEEGERMVEAARANRRVVQMGNQRRSWEKIVEAIERVRGGLIGRAYYSTGWYANRRPSIGRGKKTAVPAWLDFDLWQGPAPRRDYTDNVVHYNWHWRWHWGNGELGNNGVHAIDLCRWGLEVDYPVRVTSGGGRYHFEDDQETPDTHVVTFDFADRKSIKWEGLSCNRHSPGGGFGVTFHGDGGTVVLVGGGYTVFDLDDKEVEKVSGPGGDAEHLQNFLDATRGAAKAHAEIEGAHRSTLLCHLGNIAHRAGRMLRCDPKNGHIQGDKEAEALWSRDYAAGW